MKLRNFGSIIRFNLVFNAISILSFCSNEGFCVKLANEAVLLAIQTVSGSSPINSKSDRQQKVYRRLIEGETLTLGTNGCAEINPRLREKKEI